jgi:hypothetical protein
VASEGRRSGLRGKAEGARADFANWAERRKERWAAGLEQGGLGGVVFSFFFLLRQTIQFEFKSRFESKHPKQCNGMSATHTTIYLIQKNQTKDFSYTIFPVKKNKIWTKF